MDALSELKTPWGNDEKTVIRFMVKNGLFPTSTVDEKLRPLLDQTQSPEGLEENLTAAFHLLVKAGAIIIRGPANAPILSWAPYTQKWLDPGWDGIILNSDVPLSNHFIQARYELLIHRRNMNDNEIHALHELTSGLLQNDQTRDSSSAASSHHPVPVLHSNPPASSQPATHGYFHYQYNLPPHSYWTPYGASKDESMTDGMRTYGSVNGNGGIGGRLASGDRMLARDSHAAQKKEDTLAAAGVYIKQEEEDDSVVLEKITPYRPHRTGFFDNVPGFLD